MEQRWASERAKNQVRILKENHPMSVINKCKGHTFTILILLTFFIYRYKFCVSLFDFLTIENFFHEQAFSKEIFIALETKSIWKSNAI